MDSPINAIPVIRRHRLDRPLLRVALCRCDFGTLKIFVTPNTAIYSTSERMRPHRAHIFSGTSLSRIAVSYTFSNKPSGTKVSKEYVVNKRTNCFKISELTPAKELHGKSVQDTIDSKNKANIRSSFQCRIRSQQVVGSENRNELFIADPMDWGSRSCRRQYS